MNPHDKEKFELDSGKVITPADELELLLMAKKGIIIIYGFHDFLRNTPWSHSDN